MEALHLLAGLALILGTGFFVAVEFSLVALDQPTVQRAIDHGDTGAVPLMKCLKTLSTQLSACQLGITLTTLLTGFVLEPTISGMLAEALQDTGVPLAIAIALASMIAIVIATFFSMLLGELIPKNLAIAVPMRVGKALARPQLAFAAVFRPAISVLNGFSNWILSKMGIEAKEELSGARTPTELSSLVRRSAQLGTMDEDTATFVARTLRFGKLTADEVMTPRMRVEFLDESEPVSAILELSRRTGYSKFPLMKGSPDEVTGVVHIKNAVSVPKPERDQLTAGSIKTEVLKVPETVELDTLLAQLREANLQIAVVVDEYGGTAGLVSLEDLVEEIIGDIADEHDKKSPGVLMANDGSWYFPGLLRTDEASDQVPGLKVEDAEDYETMGGFIMAELGRIPESGDALEIESGELKVTRMDGRRVDRIKFIARVPEQEGADA